MDDERKRRSRLRSFALGGVVGAAGDDRDRPPMRRNRGVRDGGRPCGVRGCSVLPGDARPSCRGRRTSAGSQAATRCYPSASHADLRVQVSERAPARGVPRHERAGTDEVRRVRRRAARACASSRRRPLQGLGLLLDRLRPRPEMGQGVGLVRFLERRRLVELRLELRRWLGIELRQRLGVGLELRQRLVLLVESSGSSYWSGWPTRHPGPNVVVGGWGAERPAHMARTLRLSSDGSSTEEPPTLVASPPSRQ